MIKDLVKKRRASVTNNPTTTPNPTEQILENIQFYQAVDADLYTLANNAGIDGEVLNGSMPPDIALTLPFTDKEGHYLDMGSGYGRVLKWLLKEHIAPNNITSVELAPNYIKQLKKVYHQEGITIIQGNLHDYKPSQVFDNLLWMWCGVCDFPKNEQLNILRHWLNYLSKPNGVFIIESPEASEPLNSNVTHAMGSEVSIQHQGIPPWHGYMPTDDDMRSYAEQLNVDIRRVRFTTVTGRNRNLYILSHKDNTRLALLEGLPGDYVSFQE